MIPLELEESAEEEEGRNKSGLVGCSLSLLAKGGPGGIYLHLTIITTPQDSRNSARPYLRMHAVLY